MSILRPAADSPVYPVIAIRSPGTAAERVSADFDSRLPKTFEGLGVEGIEEYLKLFGFGEISNIDLPSEVKGRVPTAQWKESYFSTPESRKWYLGDTYNLSIGQGYLLATPLQLAAGVSAVANQGRLFEPRIVKEIVNPQTKEKIRIKASKTVGFKPAPGLKSSL